MATSEEKKQEMAARRKLVHELTHLGLSESSISRALGINIYLAKHAARDMADKPDPVLDNAAKDVAYSKAFSVYASLVVGGDQPTGGLRVALERYLDVPRIIAVADGIIAGINARDIFIDIPAFKPYRELFDSIWGRPKVRQYTGCTVLASLCGEVAARRIQSPTRSGLPGVLALLVASWTEVPMLPLTEFAVRHINDVLDATLTPDERTVIAKRFGLVDQQCYTLLEIGKFISRTPERARQLEERALRKLRRPAALSNYMKIFYWGIRRDYVTNLLTMAHSNPSAGVHGTSLWRYVQEPLRGKLEKTGIYFLEQLTTLSREYFEKVSSLTSDDIGEIEAVLFRLSGTWPDFKDDANLDD
jgi:Trp operon repressor